MSLDILTRGLFDYAGMFPPAALDFEAALAESARFPTALHRPGLVGNDLVLKASDLVRLDDKALEAAGWQPGRPCTVCLVGVDLADAARVAADAVAWNDRHREGQFPRRITAVEASFDGELGADVADAARQAAGDIRLYVEPKWADADWPDRQTAVLDALAELARTGPAIGLKIRCAGPTVLGHETLAGLLPEVVAHGLPLKATQGLHHPFPGAGGADRATGRADQDNGGPSPSGGESGREHGFLNLLVALRLADRLDAADIHTLLGDPEPADFVVDAGIGWREHRILAQRVQDAAARVPFAIGSCSLQEPDDDLAALYG
jgi:hypothetical protein